ncbi:MAG: hypothetical protein WCI67_05440 [Chloroflexales bacterium]
MRVRHPALAQICFFTLVVLMLTALLPGGAAATEAPPATDLTYLQTNGPSSPIAQGDWYTSTANGVGPGYHYYDITIPCGWPTTTPVYVDLFSPEMVVDAIGDEVRVVPILPGYVESIADANNTVFELYGPGTTITLPNQPGPGAAGSVAAHTYAPLPTGETWRRFATINPATCGTYVLRAETQGDDENAWRVRVGTDNDSDPTNAPPPNYDNPDGLPGTNDEIQIGVRAGSYQNDAAPGTVDCLTLYEYVAPGQTSVTFHNFDMDNLGQVRYYAPSDAYDPANPAAGGVGGTISRSADTAGGNQGWNNGGTDILRVGDTITNPASGWWKIVTCINGNNQYIQEGQTAADAYYEQPPVPVMTVAKDDGVTLTAPGDQLTYTINYANTSNATANPGSATSVVLNDTIPPNTAYVSCTIAPADGTCSYDPAARVVTYTLSHTILPGAKGSVQVTVQVDAGVANGAPVVNNVTLDYKDSMGNLFPREKATDTDTVQLTPALPVMTVAKSDGVTVTAPGNSLTYMIDYANTSGAVATNAVLKDTIPANTTYVSCAFVAPATGVALCSQAGGVVTFALAGDVAPGTGGQVKVTVTVNAGAVGTVDNTVALDYMDSLSNPRPTRHASDQDLIASPDLRLTKDASSITIRPGELITYTLTYLNDSDVTATGVVIAETVPVGTHAVAAGGTPGWSCPDNSAAGTSCTLSLGTVIGRATGSVTFIVRVDRPLVGGLTQIDNTARISDDGTHGPDPTPANNAAATRRPPTAITLQGFTISATPTGMLLKWTTGIELNSLGFQLYRSASASRSDAVLVTPQLILARGGVMGGANYSFLDTSAANGVSYSYWLVERQNGGGSSEFGPVRPASLSNGTNKIFLPLVLR